MAITTSNTFHTAAISDTISSARGYWNSSFQALLRNFNSANATPNSNNLNFEGALTTEPDGMLYYNNTTGGMYLHTTKFGQGPYGNFRRAGLGTRPYTTVAAAALDSAALDPGELIVVINDTGGTAANNRVYLVSDDNKHLIDVGIPTTDGVIANNTIVSKSITGNEIANNAITSDHIAPGTVIETDFADESVTDSKLDSSLVMLSMVL